LQKLFKMSADKAIRLLMETFFDMQATALYEKYCEELEKFIEDGYEFHIYFHSDDQNPTTKIRTVEHFRNFVKMQKQ